METNGSNGSSRSRRPVTSSDIARLCGLSRTTVSAVLNGKRNVRESTRRKVLDCIRQQNYGLGIISRTLVAELSHMIAVLAPDRGGPFQMMVFHAINDILVTHGYHVLFHNVGREDRDDPETFASIQEYRPAGYIILQGAEGPDGKHVHAIMEEGVPLVTIGGAMRGVEANTIRFDERHATRLATDYVIGKGHRRLGHLSGPGFAFGAKERKVGFIESLVEHGIVMSDVLVVEAGETAATGYEGALEMLRDPATRPTAILCFNDMVAVGAYRAAHDLGLVVPGDVSIVGFDGVDFTALLIPALTTVDISPKILGERSADLLISIIKNQTGRSVLTEWVEPKIIERASVRAIR